MHSLKYIILKRYLACLNVSQQRSTMWNVLISEQAKKQEGKLLVSGDNFTSNELSHHSVFFQFRVPQAHVWINVSDKIKVTLSCFYSQFSFQFSDLEIP